MIDPATGESSPSIADATPGDAMAALDAASAAQAELGGHRPAQRGEILRKAFDLVTRRKDDFALLMTLEMGKPLAEAYGEVDLRRRSSCAGSARRRSGSPAATASTPRAPAG